ncbi:S8 family serine peptidase [Nocardia sp. NPDC056000]|uniref:S8 family serine peptidase n=1 Tax=Nocardia sp. NPDC056000 TaxID=3345674 RepID=UPI0035DC388D
MGILVRIRKVLMLAPLVAMTTVMSVVSGAGSSSADNASDLALYHPSSGWAQGLMGAGSVTSTGAGVTIYVIDGPMNVNLPEFGGRASIAQNYFAPNTTETFLDDHATEVAVAAAGSTLGLAKQATIKSVQVRPDCSGDCVDIQRLVDGVNWVRTDHQGKGPAVAVISANLSSNIGFGHDPNHQLRDAVNALAADNVFVAVSAGNYDDTVPAPLQPLSVNACFNPPADAAGPMIAAASDASDKHVWQEITPSGAGHSVQKIWTSSGFGCADIFAPGQWIDTKLADGTDTMQSGTSFSTPYVAAAAALYKSKFGDAASPTIKTWLLQHAAPMKGLYTNWLYGNDPTGRLNLNGL